MEKYKMGEAPALPPFLIPSHHAAMGYGGQPVGVWDPNKKEIVQLDAIAA